MIKNQKILITGGAGFIGSHITERLVYLGADVVVLDDFSRGLMKNFNGIKNKKKLEIVRGSILNKKLVKKLSKNCLYIFHEAAIPLLDCEHNPRKCININTIGTFNVCESAFVNKVKKIIFSSSSSVYGEGKYLPTDEEHPFNNRNFYGATKIASEQLLISFANKFNQKFTCLRYLNIYGPRQNVNSKYSGIVIKIIKDIHFGKSTILDHNGKNTLDLVYVGDAVEANLLALSPEMSNKIYNISSGEETKLINLYHLLADLMQRNIKPTLKPGGDNFVNRRFGTFFKIQKDAGWHPKIKLKTGLSKTIDWYKSTNINKLYGNK